MRPILATFMRLSLASSLCVAWLLGCSCDAFIRDTDAGLDAAGLDARVPLPYACVSDEECGGLPCTEGRCPCASNAQCMPFRTSPPSACSEGFCVAACPYTESPRETPESFVACEGPGSDLCCGAGERCCPRYFETVQCLPGDRPCWPQCPDNGTTCAPDTWCAGAEIASGAVLRCSEVLPARDRGDAFPSGVLSAVGCLPDCPPERRCGAQTCCAEGTMCFLPRTFDPVPADGDPGIGRDLLWYAQPAGFCCIPD